MRLSRSAREGDALPSPWPDGLLCGTAGEDAAGPVPGLPERLAGLRAGERLTHDLILPRQGPDEPRREARLHLLVREVRQPVPPGPDLARLLGQPDLPALREAVAGRLREEVAAAAQAGRRALLLDALLALAPFPVPEVLVDAVFARWRAAMAARRAAGELTGAERRMTVGALEAGLRDRARRRVRADLLLETMRAPGEAGPAEAADGPAEERHAAQLDRLLDRLGPPAYSA